MKLDYWGKFVDDDHHFAEYELEGGCSKLIVTLINDMHILDNEICDWHYMGRFGKIKFINALNEYLKYNVKGFDDFTIEKKLIDIGNGDIKYPINIFESTDESCEYNMFVAGQPGELYYVLKNKMTLEEACNTNQGIVSFGMKTGEGLTFIKNYFNDEYYCREEYIPGSRLSVEVYMMEYVLKDSDTKINVCLPSAFDIPKGLRTYGYIEKVYVSELENGKYEIDVRDVDGRPESRETREGDSLYSVYYQYMVDKGYFKEKSNVKVKSK